MTKIDLLFVICLILIAVWVYVVMLGIAVDIIDLRLPEKKLKADLFRYKKLVREEYSKDEPNYRKIMKYQQKIKSLEYDLELLKQ